MTCTNGCDLPAERYVDHYRMLGASRIYPQDKTGSGLVCARCGAKHDEGFDAYEDYLATPSGERAALHDGVAASPRAGEAIEPDTAAGAPANAETPPSAAARTARVSAAAPRLAVRWLGWLIDAILSLVRRTATR